MKTIRNLMRIGLGMLAIAVLLASISRTIRVPLKDGGCVSFRQPCLIGNLFSSVCTITFNTRPGETNSVDLDQNFFEGPVMVLPSTNTNIFFCIYDHDVDWLMIRIDLSQKFQPLSTYNPMRSHLLGSTCKIERVRRVDTNDWYFVAAELETMPSKQFKDQSTGLDLLVYRLRNDQKFLAESMYTSTRSGQYEDDDPVPIYYRSEYPSTNIPFTRRHKAQYDTNSP